MRILLFSCYVLLAGVVAGRAEVGETRSQVEVQAGHCVDDDGHERLYREEEEFILVTYERDISSAEHRFTRLASEHRKELRLLCPPFPCQSRPVGEGIGLYEVAFDASGSFAKLSVVQSANSVLDHSTESYARNSWMGPPNITVTLAVAYHKTDGAQNRIYGPF